MKIPKIGYSLLFSLLLIVAFHVVSGSLPQPEGKKRRIELVRADVTAHDDKISRFATRFLGDVRFSQNNVLLDCDSAYFYTDSNKVDAFGRVHIIQGDTLNLWGDRIKYDGNSRIARVKGNVKLVNKSITLTTDELIFDLKENVGNYHTWGKIVDTANVLISKIGRYYSNEDLFFFKDSVKVTNKDFILTSDTLKYNSKTERVFIVGPTHIVGTTKRGTLYSEKGWYDTRTNIAELYKASRIFGKEQSLQGDTIFYSRDAGTGRARSRVKLTDTTNHIQIIGRKGTYNEKTKIAFVTDSAIFMQFSKKDTLFLHADTLKSIPDLTKKELLKKQPLPSLVAKKSAAAKLDSTKGNSTKKALPEGLIAAKKDSLPVRKELINISQTAVNMPVQASLPEKTPSDSAKALVESPMVATAKADIRQVVLAVSDSGKPTGLISPSINSPLPFDSLQKAAISSAKILNNKKIIPTGDSLLAAMDTARVRAKFALHPKEKYPVKDSIQIGKDTLKGKDGNDQKIFMAYHHVRFFKKDLQGICDSLSYQMKDSVMRLYNDPVLWSEEHQMTADKIEYRPHTPGPDIARMDNNGFIISREDSIKFNQISGKVLIGYIYNNTLKNIEVNGNAITLYYLKNKNHYSGMNKLESSKINVYLLNSKIDSITFFPKPEGRTIPMTELTPEDAMLKGFIWRELERPRNRFDLLPLNEKRKKIAGPEKKPASKK